MDFKEFKNTITKVGISRTSKIRNSFNTHTLYRLIRKNKWYNIGRPLTEHEFYSIVRSVNNILAEKLKKGETVVFPHRMGKVELRKYKKGVSIKNGKLKITYQINWLDTLKLWYEDKEAMDNKTLVRYESPDYYRLVYDKYDANYINKTFYQFKLNRFVHNGLKDNLKKGAIDALW